MKFTGYLWRLLSFFCLIGLFGVAACNEDEEAPGITNGFTVNGTFYPTQFGYFNERSLGQTVLFYELYISSEPIDLSDPDFLEGDFNSLDILAFSLIPNQPDIIPMGTISYADFSNPLLTEPSFFSTGGIDLNINEENGVLLEIADGELTVQQQSEVYDLSFRLTTNDNEIITGSFSGELIRN
ncbi:MAG: hypothetical protein AAFN93_11675 [Bacteroidota bacterium]